jgi:hypothetical protein
MEEEERGWRKLDVELHNFYSSPNVIKVVISKLDKVGGACRTYAGENKCI